MFNIGQITQVLEEFQADVDRKSLTTLQYLGEEFVNKARLSDTYTDRTGNLRSSIGYIILKDGEVVDMNFEGGVEGKRKAEEFAKSIGIAHSHGYVLIGVAGMDYAAAVESKGYDVITGSAPTDNDVKSMLNEIFA